MIVSHKLAAGFIRYYLILLLALFVSLISILFIGPVAFQKSNLIKVNDQVFADVEDPSGDLDVAEFLSAIPYQDQPEMIWDVLPSEKYRKAIIGGGGNCSNLVFGAAYYFLNEDFDFSIIHLMPKDSFLRGGGHTVLEAGFTLAGIRQLGIVDVLEGGVPVDENGVPLRVSALGRNTIEKLQGEILRLNQLKTGLSRYWHNDFLGDVTVGVISGEDVKSYFNFINDYYIPLGGGKIEKYAFDGLALFFGKLPTIYVNSRGYQELFASGSNHSVLISSKIILFLNRLFIYGLIFLMLLHLIYRVCTFLSKPNHLVRR